MRQEGASDRSGSVPDTDVQPGEPAAVDQGHLLRGWALGAMRLATFDTGRLSAGNRQQFGRQPGPSRGRREDVPARPETADVPAACLLTHSDDVSEARFSCEASRWSGQGSRGGHQR